MEFEKHEKKWVKHLRRVAWFTGGAIVFFIVALSVAPCLGIREGGKISLSRLQLAYGLLSAIIAVALYVWGVGDWSRFEPPKGPQDSTSKPSDSKAAPTVAPGAGAAAGNAPVTPPPITPTPPKGGN